jgi:hypothetical protein
MSDFKGFKISPQGQAKIEIRDSVLVVSNIGASGLDGVLIETYPRKSIVVNFEYGTLNDKTQLNVRYIGKDTLMRINTLGEFNFSRMAEDNKFGVSVNSRLLPDSVKLVGKLGNKIVYQKQLANPVFNTDKKLIIIPLIIPPIPPVWLALVVVAGVVAGAYYIADHVHFEHTTSCDANGHVTSSTTYGWGKVATLPVEDNEGEIINADEFELIANYIFNSKSNNKPNEVFGIVCTAANIDKIIIKDIIARK